MALTPAQLQTLKAAINANPVWAAYPMTQDGYFDLAVALSALASPNFWVWSTNADVTKLRAGIVGAFMTPADNPDGTQAYANRCLQCQGKQFNLQLFLPFTGTINCADANFRATIEDSLKKVPSGAGGALQDAGWAAVRNAMARLAKYIEKIFADTTGGQDGSTKALSATMVYEGNALASDVEAARNLP